jgi:hypothetical protein
VPISESRRYSKVKNVSRHESCRPHKIQLRDQGGFKCVSKKAMIVGILVIAAGFFRSLCVKALLAQVLPACAMIKDFSLKPPLISAEFYEALIFLLLFASRQKVSSKKRLGLCLKIGVLCLTQWFSVFYPLTK